MKASNHRQNIPIVFHFLILFFIFSLGSCGMSSEKVLSIVKESLQQKLSNDSEFKSFNLVVQDLKVAKISAGKYDGLADIKFRDKSYSVPLDITVDGNQVLWSSKPLAFGFLAAAKIERAVFDSATEEIKKYNLMKPRSSNVDLCIMAKSIANIFLSLNDELAFKHWDDVQQEHCDKPMFGANRSDDRVISPVLQLEQDQIKRYDYLVNSGSAGERCVQAGFILGIVSSDSDKAKKWMDIQQRECSVAGLR